MRLAQSILIKLYSGGLSAVPSFLPRRDTYIKSVIKHNSPRFPQGLFGTWLTFLQLIFYCLRRHTVGLDQDMITMSQIIND